MKIYSIDNFSLKDKKRASTSPEALFSISIDTGLITSGICILDLKLSTVKLLSLNTKENYISSNFIENLVMSEIQITHYLKIFSDNNIDLTKTIFNIEHTVYNPEFSFGLGLNIFLTSLVKTLLHKKVLRINLIPPRVTQYFLSEYKLKDSKIKAWVKYFLPMFYKECKNAHIIDALLHSIFIHYDYYQSNFNIDIRIPDKQIFTINDFI